jgi:superfamily II RNA helicase
MITEMVLHSVLDKKQPSEIAALLSCLVFQQKTRPFQQRNRDEPQLTEGLKKVYHSYRSSPLSDLPLDAGLPTFFYCTDNFVSTWIFDPYARNRKFSTQND